MALGIRQIVSSIILTLGLHSWAQRKIGKDQQTFKTLGWLTDNLNFVLSTNLIAQIILITYFIFMNFQIKKASLDDCKGLSELCKSIYVEHYLHLWLEGGKDWYLEKSYSENVILAEIKHPNSDYFMLTIDSSSVGYLKVNYDYSEKSSALEVERIYFHQSHKGLGLGRKLMEFAFALAKQRGKESVILKAMDSSQDAIGFYHKIGFKQIGTLILEDYKLMKPEFRGMIILEYCL